MNDVGRWLTSISLPQYFHAFQYHSYTSIDKCARISHADLDLIGIGPAGHRKRILSRLPHVKESKKEDKPFPKAPPRNSRGKRLSFKSDMNNSGHAPPPSPCGNPSGAMYLNQHVAVPRDVPQSSNHSSVAEDDDDNIYMNYDNQVMKADHKPSHRDLPPPALPVKTRKLSGNLAGNLQPTRPVSTGPSLSPKPPSPVPPHAPTPPHSNKKPVPKPRTSLDKKKKEQAQQALGSPTTKQPLARAPSIPLAGVTIEESTDESDTNPADSKETAYIVQDEELYAAPKSYAKPVTPTSPSSDFDSPVYEDIREVSDQPPYKASDRNTPPLYDTVYEGIVDSSVPASVPPRLPPLPARCSSRVSSDYEMLDPEVPSPLDVSLPVQAAAQLSGSVVRNRNSSTNEELYDQAINVSSARSSIASHRASLLRANAVEQVSTEHTDDDLNRLVHPPTSIDVPERSENIYGEDPTDPAALGSSPLPPKHADDTTEPAALSALPLPPTYEDESLVIAALGPSPLPPKPRSPSVTSPKVPMRTVTLPEPPNISERIVMGAETPDEEKDNQSNEFLEGKSRPRTTGEAASGLDSEHSVYDGVWNHGTGAPLISFDEKTVTKLSTIEEQDRLQDTDANVSRESHYGPPPPFAPPPLPPGIGHTDTPPPVIPPRPKPPKIGDTKLQTPETSPVSVGDTNRFSQLDPFDFQRSFSNDDPFAKSDPFSSTNTFSETEESASTEPKRRSLSLTNPRNTMADFADFTRSRVEQTQNSTSTPVRADDTPVRADDCCAGASSSSDMCGATSGDCSSSKPSTKPKRLSEDNIYGPMPLTRQASNTSSDSGSSLYAKPTRKAPRPPKKENPFKGIYDQRRGTYNVPDEDPMNTSFDYSAASVWESDDTLSDGGDFYEGDHPIPFPASHVPIVPAVQHKVTERSGYLYKQASKRSSRINVWTKRYASYGNGEFRYYSSSKSKVSKRIIPVVTMMNIQQDIKTGESHPYRFTIITIDRCYTFALDDNDDMTMWASVLMTDILENDTLSSSFLEGGAMHAPDKEGFIKMDGIRGKRYLAIKKDKFCYYNTYNDFKVDSPIHRIEMQIGSVKDLGKNNKLQLNTPFASYIFIFDSSIELADWKSAFEESIAESLGDDELLDQVYENHSNKFCADCGGPDPHWASVNFCVTLCKQCAGIHRTLTIPVSKIRSLRMDSKVWTPQLLQLMKVIGNDNANNFWEWHASEDDKIDSEDDLPTRKVYIINKYEKKKYCRFHPLIDDETALNEALCKNVCFADVQETMQIVFSGADILYSSSAYSEDHETAYQIAKRNKQTMQEEFLYQNGGTLERNPNSSLSGKKFRKPPSDMLPRDAISMKGYLLKTGSNQKGDFLRRWVVLENGTLRYYENEKSCDHRNSIDKKEMLSVTKVSDDRYDFTFEIGTTKHGGRVYLFAAENCEERKKWVVAIAKEIAGLKGGSRDKIKDLDKGGAIFQRSGATRDWKVCWIHLRRKTLYIYKKDKDVFEELDLRKAKGIKKLQQTERCLEAFDEGQPFVVDLPERAVYMQGDMRRETECWYKTLYEAIMNSTSLLEDQQLTMEDIPVALDKCLDFVTLHGMDSEGIYRLNGQHSKVTRLLDLFSIDARDVHLNLAEYNINDVATTLKRFLRSLEDPLLTKKSYEKWITTSTIQEPEGKITWYKFLLSELPKVHYNSLQKLVIHLARVSHQEPKNRMSIVNIASIFGPVTMNAEQDDQVSAGFKTTNQEIAVMKDLLENYTTLFEVNDEKERKMKEAEKKLRELQERPPQPVTEEVQLWMTVEMADDTRDVCRKISAETLAEEVLEGACKAANLNPSIKWGLFEQICNGELERPVHYREKVMSITKKWGDLPADFRTNSRLVIKVNQVYEKIELIFQPNNALFSELKYTEEKKKSYKKAYFEFGQYKLSYRKDTKASSNPTASWNVEDLLVYIGIQKKRNPPTGYGFSFIRNEEKVHTPYFGHGVCCSSEEELYRWIGAILTAQHPGGLEPGSQAGAASLQNRPPPPSPGGHTGRGPPSRPLPNNFGSYPQIKRGTPSKSSISKLKEMFSKR